MPDWADFTIALGRTLAEFVDGERLIVSQRSQSAVYVQAAQDEGELVVETVADYFLPDEQRIGAAGAESLRAAGWIEPTGPRENWQRLLTWPARTAEYQNAAAAMASSLRDVHGLPDPSQLVYEAWTEGPTGRRDLDLPRLGLPRA